LSVRRSVVGVLGCITLLGSWVTAEALEITAGTFMVESSVGPAQVHISGPGLIFNATGGVFGGVAPGCPVGCLPGEIVPMNSLWSGTDLTGTAVVNGVVFPDVGSLVPGAPQASLGFTASALAPPFSGNVDVFPMARFTFTGAFSSTSGGGFTVLPLAGTGSVSLHLEWAPELPTPLWLSREAVYTFAPVPEAATLVLFGSALGAAVAVARRRRRAGPTR